MFVACGLNHKTAALEIREKISLPIHEQSALLSELINSHGVEEAVILSTCNRTEIFCNTDDPIRILHWLSQVKQLSFAEIEQHCYIYSDDEAVKHTLRVASGLDSMMLGEPQILGQMKQAYQIACQADAVKQTLHQIFQFVFRASKNIRNTSGLGNNPISIAFAAVQLINRVFTTQQSLNILMIGSGETSSLVAKYLQKRGNNNFMIASRTMQSAQYLAVNLSGEAVNIADIPLYIPKADVVISATSCPLPFITKALVQNIRDTYHAPIFFLDLAVPRDIEPGVGELNSVHLYNVDDLQQMTEQGLNARRESAALAEKLVESELENYQRTNRTLRAQQIICDYRKRMQDLAQQELERALQKLSLGQCQYDVLTQFSERLVNKLIHTPTTSLKKAACDQHDDLLNFAQHLFNTSSPYGNLIDKQDNYEKIT